MLKAKKSRDLRVIIGQLLGTQVCMLSVSWNMLGQKRNVVRMYE